MSVVLEATNVLSQQQAVWHTKPRSAEAVALRAADARFATARVCALPSHRQTLSLEWWGETYALVAQFIEVCRLSEDEATALYRECYKLRQITTT